MTAATASACSRMSVSSEPSAITRISGSVPDGRTTTRPVVQVIHQIMETDIQKEHIPQEMELNINNIDQFLKGLLTKKQYEFFKLRYEEVKAKEKKKESWFFC